MDQVLIKQKSAETIGSELKSNSMIEQVEMLLLNTMVL